MPPTIFVLFLLFAVEEVEREKFCRLLRVSAGMIGSLGEEEGKF
jgi:hypothetical protein